MRCTTISLHTNATVCDRNVIVEIHIIHRMIVHNDLTNNVLRGNTYMEMEYL